MKLKSQLHFSNAQAVAGVVLMGQNMFDLHGSFSIPTKTASILTLHRHQQIIIVSKLELGLVLNSIFEKIMISDGFSTITYHNEGSNWSSKDRTWSALPDALLGVIK